MSAVASRTVLHLQDGDFRYASRVLKQARAALLAGGAARVDLLGHVFNGAPSVEQLEPGLFVHRTVMPPAARVRGWGPALARLVIRWWRFVLEGRRIPCDLIHCHSVGALVPSIALGLIHRVPVVYDAHELESQAGQPRAAGVLALWIERVFIRRAAGVICVSDKIADWYSQEFGIARPVVVRNVPDTANQRESENDRPLRTSTGLGGGDLLFLYQGALAKGRRIEQLLRVFAEVPPDRHIVFMGYGVLQPLVEAAAAKHANIHFVPAVPPDLVLAHTRDADVGICGGENVCLSYYLSLPNKLFEYLHGGIPVLAPRWPEMEDVINQHRCGWSVGETDAEWRASIVGLTRNDIRAAGAGARNAAQSYSWTAESKVMLDLYAAALAGQGGL